MKDKVFIHRRLKSKPLAEQSLQTAAQVPDDQGIFEDQAEFENALTKKDLRALKHLARDYEKALDYYYLRHKPWRNILLGLVSGMSQGLGIAIGITVLAFILISILKSLQVLDLPFLGNFLAQLLDYIEHARSGGIYNY
jgi:hypothetical protein